MDYEQKYKKALKAVKELQENNPSDDGIQNWVNEKFPELFKDEDEKIRKEIKQLIQGMHDADPRKERWLTWLEKQGTPARLSEEEQNRFAKGVLTSCALSFINYLDAHKYEGKMCVSNGECEDIENAFHNAMWDRLHRYYCKYIEKQEEQKPVDKVEPKFHIGDWVVDEDDNNIYQIENVIENVTNGKFSYDLVGGGYFPSTKKNYHLWTIQDAKDGDVLAFYSEYKGNKMVQVGIIKKYVGKHGGCSNTFNIYVGVNWEKKLQIGEYMGCSDIRPATKEQRDLLFQKMKEAGYEWNANKKELKKIELKPMLSDFFNAEYERGKADALKCVGYSEEDEKIINKLIAVVELYYGIGDDSEKQICLSWLKSLKQRNTWKPSDEQMKGLSVAKDSCSDLSYKTKNTLKSLYNDLKRLREK